MKTRSPAAHNSTERASWRSRAGLLVRLTLALLVVTAVVHPAVASAQDAGQSPDDSLVEIVKGVNFGSTPNSPLLLNVYKPKTSEIGRPAIVLVHGGSWTQGDPDMMDTQGKLLAQQGWVGFSVSYRLATKGNPSWSGNVDDVRTAVRWVGDHARDYGADPSRIALLGESAGGHLAALVGMTGFDAAPASTDPKAPRIRAVATLSAPLALDQLVPQQGAAPTSCGEDRRCKEFWQFPLVPGMLGCNPDQCPETYVAASPDKQVTPTSPPLYLANSTEEIVPLDQVDRMASAAAAKGVTVQTQRVDGSKHGNEITAKVWNQMVPFLADALGVPTPQPIQFAEERELKDYLLFIFVGLFAIGLLFVFILAAIRGKWDEPGA